MLEAGESNIMDNFNISHTAAIEKLSVLSFIPRTFNPALEETKKPTKGKRLSVGATRQTTTSPTPMVDIYPKILSVDLQC